MLSNFGRADGGRETWAYNFIPRLLRRYPGLRLHVVGLRVDGEPDNSDSLLKSVDERDRDRLSTGFVRARANRLPNALSFWTGLRRAAPTRAASPRFVVAVGSFVELAAVLISDTYRRSGKILWLRTIFADEKAHRIPRAARPLLQRIEDAVLRRADLLIANGEDTAEHYRRRGFDVRVIANAIELDRWRLPPPAFANPVNIAYIGRLTQVKGIEEFIAAARLANERDRARFAFHVVGDGPLKTTVERAAAQGLLRYHGAIANESVPAFLEGMDACVALGFAGGERGGSGISNALLEQAATGRLLICWDNRAYRQVLDERSCCFVGQGDVGHLAGTFVRIAQDPGKAVARARAAMAVAAGYGIDQHMDQFARVAAKWLPAASGADAEAT